MAEWKSNGPQQEAELVGSIRGDAAIVSVKSLSFNVLISLLEERREKSVVMKFEHERNGKYHAEQNTTNEQGIKHNTKGFRVCLIQCMHLSLSLWIVKNKAKSC